MVKISAFAAFAVLAAIAAAAPTSAQPHHSAAAYRGHTRAVVVDPNGLDALARVPGGLPGASSYDPALTGGGSTGYNAGVHDNF